MRTRVHLTNPEFADAIGVSRSMASRLRSGARRPSIPVAELILATYCPQNRLREGLEAFADSGDKQRVFLASLVGETVADDE